jgi:hypothetical protein
MERHTAPNPTPPGEWEAFTYGHTYRGWILRCGPAMIGQVPSSGGKFYCELNHDGMGPRDTLEEAKSAIEEAIITGVREMLLAYKVVIRRREKKHW